MKQGCRCTLTTFKGRASTARGSIHKIILSWFSERQKGKVLDAPAGFGHLSMRLKEIGFDVVCGEIEPEIFKVSGLRCIYTDLNERIESPDDALDYVCCVDGLEHMTNPYRAVQEFTRVLKPGGYASSQGAVQAAAKQCG